MFSATLPRPIMALARSFQNDAMRIEVKGGEGGHADIEYRATRVLPREIAHTVVNTLRFVEATTALVFCNTREAVRHLQALLLERGFSVVSLSGELSQNERNQALQALRDGRARVCVATDVAARGIDLPSLGLVIHADLPHDAEALQHRSGRTGRAGRKGISVLLVPPSRRRRAEQMMAVAGVVPVWGGPPSAEEIRLLDQERLLRDPLLTDETGEDDLAMAKALLAERSPEDVASALVRLYRSRLPAPEDVSDPGFAPPRREPRTAEPRRGRDEGRGAPGDGRDGTGGGTWFRVSIGRNNNADPKWLLPMLCKRGGVTRQDIGVIRIFERETKVEIRDEAVPRFAKAVRGTETGGIRIEPVGGPDHGGHKPARAGGRRDRPNR
jgi:ATP-dependent RNA helicase DeaD